MAFFFYFTYGGGAVEHISKFQSRYFRFEDFNKLAHDWSMHENIISRDASLASISEFSSY